MLANIEFRKQAVRQLTQSIGVYVLCDLDGVPVYVGQSTDGIRARVRRHLSSARSDVIANRQIDVWEIAYVWEYPVARREEIGPLEAALFHNYHAIQPLMNGTIPPLPQVPVALPEPSNIVQVVPDAEIAERKKMEQRLPRQAQHYAQIVNHFVVVKNSTQIANSLDAHFQRLSNYHAQMLGNSISDE